jgi:hypothetical protein
MYRFLPGRPEENHEGSSGVATDTETRDHHNNVQTVPLSLLNISTDIRNYWLSARHRPEL